LNETEQTEQNRTEQKRILNDRVERMNVNTKTNECELKTTGKINKKNR
jgi:hypothetical protein